MFEWESVWTGDDTLRGVTDLRPVGFLIGLRSGIGMEAFSLWPLSPVSESSRNFLVFRGEDNLRTWRLEVFEEWLAFLGPLPAALAAELLEDHLMDLFESKTLPLGSLSHYEEVLAQRLDT